MIIYKITNLKNGKIYVGQTTKTAEQRLAKHWNEALCGSRANNYFHNALLKYGKESFVIEEIDSASTIDELNLKEIYWIERLNARDKNVGYNLMTGGKSGIKSDETKELLRQRKIENWKNEELVPKMLDGLRKGTDSWKEICRNRRVDFICPVCGKKLSLPPYEAKIRKTCSLQCAGKISNGLIKATNAVVEKHINRDKTIHEKIHEWIDNNAELIMSCASNKISTTLAGLKEFMIQNFNIRDWRSIGLAICGSDSRKELLKYLKSECENVRCSGLK